MKKILFTLLLLLSATIGWALPIMDENGYYWVSNLQELKDAVNATKDSQGKSTSKIKLINHIYLNGMDGTLCTTFAGEIDGSYTFINEKGEEQVSGHMIFGYGADEKDKETKTRKKCSYLFTYMKGATIKHVGFYAIRIESSDRDNMGVIASQAESSTFDGIGIDSCSIYTDEDKAGAVVGLAKACTFSCIFVKQCDVTVDGVKAGGLVGDSEGNKFSYCSVGAGSAVFADGTNWGNHGWSGGLVGYSKNDQFSNCISMALVGADQQHVGGFAGESVGSDFYQCVNGGFAANIDETDFRKFHKEIEEYLKKNNTDLTDAFTAGVLAGGVAALGTAETLCLVFPAQTIFYDVVAPDLTEQFIFFVCRESLHRGTQGTSYISGWGFTTGAGFGSAVAIVAVAAIIIAIAVEIGIYIYLGDDEVGGICGTATGGTFEQCINSGTLSCSDDYVGGIVGLGTAVTINNCMNTGTIKYDETDTYGSMLGKALADGSKKCKVTNCFSETPYTMIGSEGISAGVDPASGNNYRMKGTEETTCDWEMVIPAFGVDLNEHLVGYWLNNGFENRRAGIAPWRYSSDAVNGKYIWYPVLYTSHDEITVESLRHVEISSAEELLAYAAAVNNGEQYKVGILTADIVIPAGTEWIPIGCSDSKFRGVFDGQGHTISGLENVYSPSDVHGVGLFGTVHVGAIIRNVNVKESVFANGGEGGVAGIVGRVGIEGWRWGNVIIENCASYADVYAGENGGGILGRVLTKTDDDPGVHVIVENCFNGGTITASAGKSGLLCGYTKHNGHIRNCWSAGQLKHYDDDWRTTPPYNTENSKNNEPEYLVGYRNKIDIQNCYILDAKNIIDDYNEGKMQDGVTDIKDAELARGVLTWKLNGKTNDVTKSLTWQQELGKDAYPVPGNKGLYHTREIAKDKYGTVCLPYPIKSDEHISYYTFVSDEIGDGTLKLNFEYADSVPAAVPALFFSAEEQTYYFPGAGDDLINENANCTTYSQTPDSEWLFVGYLSQEVVIDDAEQAKSFYYLSDGTIRNAKKLTVSPYRAFFHGPSIDKLKNMLGNPSTARISIVIDGIEDETTALELVYDYEHHNENDNRSYTLFGTEAGEGYRGIVIRGGKKVIVNN